MAQKEGVSDDYEHDQHTREMYECIEMYIRGPMYICILDVLHRKPPGTTRTPIKLPLEYISNLSPAGMETDVVQETTRCSLVYNLGNIKVHWPIVYENLIRGLGDVFQDRSGRAAYFILLLYSRFP